MAWHHVADPQMELERPGRFLYIFPAQLRMPASSPKGSTAGNQC